MYEIDGKAAAQGNEGCQNAERFLKEILVFGKDLLSFYPK